MKTILELARVAFIGKGVGNVLRLDVVDVCGFFCVSDLIVPPLRDLHFRDAAGVSVSNP